VSGPPGPTGSVVIPTYQRRELVQRAIASVLAQTYRDFELIVALLDSDDRWLPDHLAVVVEVLERHPEAVLVSTSPHMVFAGRARPSRARLLQPPPPRFLGQLVGYPSSIPVRAEVLHQVGAFDERLQTGEDRDLWERLATWASPSGSCSGAR
jgi:hypothetical protein